MSSQTEVFQRLVTESMRAAPVMARGNESCGALVRAMARTKASCAIIADEDNRPLGILTEQDIVRRVTFQLPENTPAADVMTAPVTVIREDDYLFHAIAVMRRKQLRHIPVVRRNGVICGLLALHDALGIASPRTMKMIDRLTHEETIKGLGKVKKAQVKLADTLFDDNAPAPDIQALLTGINRDIHRRIVDRALGEMNDDGWGAPPVKFAVIVMGSGGRGENFLFPDQDNGFVLEDYPAKDHSRIDPFFIELAERMTIALDQVGIPLCRGAVMATNPLWRKSLSEWKKQIAYWMRARNEITLRMCDIFFDFRTASGEAALTQELRSYVTKITAKNPGFLKDMFSLEADHKVALGWFGRLISKKDKQNREGMVNLKYGGTLPLVEGARLLALRHGIPETATLERLAALHKKGVLMDNEYDYLSGAFTFISRLLLRQQIDDFKAGEDVGNFVPENSLSRREKDYLVQCFRAIEDLRGRLKSELSGEGF